MSWSEIKSAINSSVGTVSFDSLDKIIEKESYENYYNTTYTMVDGGLLDPLKVEIVRRGTKEIKAFAYENRTQYKRIVLPIGLQVIGGGAFAGCSQLGGMVIPEGVTTISQNAFNGCLAMKDVVIPDSVTAIGTQAFRSCGLMHVKLSNKMQGISEHLFYGCTMLESVMIPRGIKLIQQYAFGDCPELSDVYYEGTLEEWNNITVQYGNDDLIGANIHTIDS